MSSFNWSDPFHFTQQLTDDERAIADVARFYATQKLLPRITQAAREHAFDPLVLKEMGNLGFLGSTLKDYGCAGVSHVAYGLIAHEIEAVDSAYRSSLSVQSSLVMYPIDTFGTTWQRQYYLPKLASGELIGCFGLTEPDHGSDPANMQTKCQLVDGGYRLTGCKSWITHAPVADIAIVWAKDTEGQIRGLIVERQDMGFGTSTITGKMSLCASITGQLVFDNVFVPNERVLNVIGFKGPFSCLNKARYGIAWGALGAARDCWLRAREYTLTRHQFAKPLAANQLIQKKLVDMQTEITLGLQAVLRVGQLMDETNTNLTATPEMISLIKRNSCGKALEIARMARDILGANGIHEDYAVMRHLVNLESVNTYEGTHDIHALILGRAQTGISAF